MVPQQGFQWNPYVNVQGRRERERPRVIIWAQAPSDRGGTSCLKVE